MKTDIQIAQEATLQPIKEVAATIGIEEEDLELYGKYKAKISDELIARRFKSSIGTTWEYPPPAAPPLIPKHGPSEGSRNAIIAFFPSFANA